MLTTAPEKTLTLKSPVSERAQRLRPPQEIVLQPYYGAKKRLPLVHTHYVIGSAPDCEILVDDPFVSPRHAELRLLPNGEGYYIEDLESTNGTFVNGIRVKSAPLAAQGTLRFGRSSLVWSQENEEPAEFLANGFVAADPAMREILQRLRTIAKSELPVLILGETGTGKEIFAHLLHQWSGRARGPYVAVNGALTGGTLAESELFGHRKGAFTGADSARLGALRGAHGGTLFLDELADVPRGAQVKLLRALESGEVRALGSDAAEKANFRLVSATSQDLEGRLADGSFRLDLYYRVAGYTLVIPPLRDRPRDIVAISQKYLGDRGLELDAEAEASLLSYRWPGNVRELRSWLERAAITAVAESAGRVLAAHLVGLHSSAAAERPHVRGRTLAQIEADSIRSSLERNGWSRSVVSEELGIARSTLFSKMRRFGIRDGAML